MKVTNQTNILSWFDDHCFLHWASNKHWATYGPKVKSSANKNERKEMLGGTILPWRLKDPIKYFFADMVLNFPIGKSFVQKGGVGVRGTPYPLIKCFGV